MIKYRIDVMNALKERNIGYFACKKEKLLPYSTIEKIVKNDTNISMQSLNALCLLLDMTIDDILEFIETPEEREELEKKLDNLKNKKVGRPKSEDILE